MSGEALIAVDGLRKGFSFTTGRGLRQRKGWLWAVDGVSFSLSPGETFGVVGESGCGKSTLAMLLLGLETPSEGAIHYKGIEVARLNTGERRAFRGAVQAVFQDPWSSLSPRQRIRDIVAEPLLVQGRLSAPERERKVRDLMESVGLVVSHGDLFPHEFSGGQRQRICIARALSVDPELMVLDEPLSALDVSVQAQIINLLRAVQERTAMSYLFISHSLPAVRYLCSRVAVMYLGQVVELAPTARLFSARLHPYTRNLIAAARPLEPRQDGQAMVDGEIPSPANPPPGCRFHTRCSEALARCREEVPALREVEPGHQVRCHLYAA